MDTPNPSSEHEHEHFLLTTDTTTGVALLRFDRPAKRNAFSQSMITTLCSLLADLDRSPSVRVVILTGSPDGPFCAGMDISELSLLTPASAHARHFLRDLTDALARFSKPLIAAVVGFALGGGFEIALACDIILASTTATFALPEVKIGTIPGAGGTQRLVRALGKHRAMHLVLTGSSLTGIELFEAGAASEALPAHEVLDAAMELAGRIGRMSGPVVRAGKQAVLTAETSHLAEGMAAERMLYYSTFGLEDFKEGQKAFLEKRGAVFKHL
ncbi:enoyl-CoA hydratase [Podospora conica]|nr:enoyl-CoA hydratase [Schizothecium conicum]